MKLFNSYSFIKYLINMSLEVIEYLPGISYVTAKKICNTNGYDMKVDRINNIKIKNINIICKEKYKYNGTVYVAISLSNYNNIDKLTENILQTSTIKYFVKFISS